MGIASYADAAKLVERLRELAIFWRGEGQYGDIAELCDDGPTIEYSRSAKQTAEAFDSGARLLAAQASQIEALAKSLRTVQNAAKTITSTHATELEHLRQNATFDHRLRGEHESLIERDALMTEALEQAESRATAAEAKAAKMREAVKTFVNGYLVDERDDPELCFDDEHRAAVLGLWAALDQEARP